MDAVTGLPRTALSMERYRTLLSFSPAFYWQAAGQTVFPLVNQCDDIFYQFYWQNEQQVSREEIAQAIVEAENDIAKVIGLPVAPWWWEDVYNYPRYYRRDVFEFGMSDNRGANKSVQLTRGGFLQGGQRATTLITANAAVVRTDTDGDGYKETATITTPTASTDKCEIHCYFAGELANPDWEVRTPRSITLTGGNVIFTFWSWQLIDPELQQRFTVTGQSEPIDIEANASYVSVVDVYREYNDFTAVSSQLLWERVNAFNLGIVPVGWCCSSCGGSGCIACELYAVDGCIHVQNAEGTFVVPTPATYDSDAGQWQADYTSLCRDPDMVKVWYYAGNTSQDFKAGRNCDPLDRNLAQAIAWLATARVNRPFCACNNSLAFPGPNSLQRDASFTGSRELGTFAISQQDLENPFGTKIGEIRAWKQVGRMTSSTMMGAVA